MAIDVTSLANRRATDRWNRVAVGDMLERLTWSYPDQHAFIGWPGAFAYPEHERLSYRQADRLANRLANALLAAGLSGKDRVLLVCENSVEAVVAKFAIAKAGLVVAPVNPSLAADVVEDVIRRVEPRLAIVDAEVWPRVAAAFARAGMPVAITIPIGIPPGGDLIPGSQGLLDFLAAAPDTEPDVEIHGDDICELQFTSGTTAMPKAVMLSHTNAYFAASGYALTLTRGLRSESELRMCSFLPLIYHIGGHVFLLPVLLSGGTIVIGRKPIAAAVAQAVVREQITALWAGSPVMVQALLETMQRAQLTAPHLHVVLYGWAAISPAQLAALEKLTTDHVVAVEIFGQTEAIACHRFWPHRWREVFLAHCPESNYVGVPSPLLASDILAPDGSSLAGQPGVVGEAVYRSPVVMQGYYRDEAATHTAFARGWFHSGDSCVYDGAGLRVMVDRLKDIVKTGGENVSSLRVESVLVQHPGIIRAAVVGLPDPRCGEVVTACVMRKPGTDPVDEAALIDFCRARLAGFETPKRVIFVDRYPETVGGKVMKHVLRAELRQAK
jgi:acyl-CoA synthetase (AMP-forming)/AMP-acid ligase II